MTTPAHRRKTDARPHRERLDEMTSAERQAIHLRRLASEVAAACDRFFLSRDMPMRLPFMDTLPRPVTQAPPPPSSGESAPTGEDVPTGGRDQKSEASIPRTDRAHFFPRDPKKQKTRNP